MAELHKITERGMVLMPGKPPELQQRLQEAHDLFSFVEQEFPNLLEELAEQRDSNKATS
jgi:hypothetical protein